jgi:hypothetical protein
MSVRLTVLAGKRHSCCWIQWSIGGGDSRGIGDWGSGSCGGQGSRGSESRRREDRGGGGKGGAAAAPTALALNGVTGNSDCETSNSAPVRVLEAVPAGGCTRLAPAAPVHDASRVAAAPPPA